MKSDTEVIDLFTKHRKLARGLSKQLDNTDLTWSYYSDSDSSYEDQVQFADATGRKRKALVNFQKIPQYIDAVVGFMAQNRRQAKFIARINDDPARNVYSKNMNAVYSFHRENMNADQLESKQDLEVCVNGYGAIETDLSYIVGKSTNLPNGEIVKRNLDPLKVYWDTSSSSPKPNLMDSGFMGYWDEYYLQDALDLFQNSKEEDFESAAATDNDDDRGFVYNPWGGLYDRIKASNIVDWSNKKEDRVKVYNHQWREFETYYKCKNPIWTASDPMDALYMQMRLESIKDNLKSYAPDGIDAGDLFDFDPMAEDLTFDGATKSKLVAEFGDLIDPVSFIRECYYTAVISGKHVFSKFKSISQRGFSIQIKTGNYNKRGGYWIGMVNAMMEPQRFYNKFLTELIFTIAASSKGGVIIEEDAVEDIADFESKVAKTDAVAVVNSGAIGAGKIMFKAQASIPTGLDALMQFCETTIAANGVDPAFLGNSNDNESGILFKRRIRQATSKIWWVADAATLYQKEEARLMLDLMPIWIENNQGETIRVTGTDGSDQFLQLSQDKFAAAYDVDIQEAPTTPEETSELSTSIMNLASQAAQAGNAVVGGQLAYEAIDMWPIDGDKKARLKTILVPDQNMVPAQQVQQTIQQLQQQIAQLTSAQTQATVANIQSQTALNTAKVQESGANAQNKTADTFVKSEQAKKEHIEGTVIARHAADANVTI